MRIAVASRTIATTTTIIALIIAEAERSGADVVLPSRFFAVLADRNAARTPIRDSREIAFTRRNSCMESSLSLPPTLSLSYYLLLFFSFFFFFLYTYLLRLLCEIRAGADTRRIGHAYRTSGAPRKTVDTDTVISAAATFIISAPERGYINFYDLETTGRITVFYRLDVRIGYNARGSALYAVTDTPTRAQWISLERRNTFAEVFSHGQSQFCPAHVPIAPLVPRPRIAVTRALPPQR